MENKDDLKLRLEDTELDRDAALFRENMWHEEYDKRCELFQHLMEKYRLIVIQVRNLTGEKQNILTAYDC